MIAHHYLWHRCPRFIPTHVGQIYRAVPIRLSQHRFIPTHVGQMIQRTICSRAHFNGSSPRMWGRLQQTFDKSRSFAVHPHACGADDSAALPLASLSTVHPHACGADSLTALGNSNIITVHPHACGADAYRRARCYHARRFIPTHVGQMYPFGQPRSGPERFIPTHVGQMLCRPKYPVRSRAVHPHACGADG